MWGFGGELTVTDGTTTLDPVTEIDFTSGATVTDGGDGIAQVAVTGGGVLDYVFDVVVNLPTIPAGDSWANIADVVGVFQSNYWSVPAAAYGSGYIGGTDSRVAVFNNDERLTTGLFALGLVVWDVAMDNYISVHGTLSSPAYNLGQHLSDFTLSVDASTGSDLSWDGTGISSAGGGQYAMALGLQCGLP
jgi:hypothetical protein